jgi:hypothetical protein
VKDNILRVLLRNEIFGFLFISTIVCYIFFFVFYDLYGSKEMTPHIRSFFIVLFWILPGSIVSIIAAYLLKYFDEVKFKYVFYILVPLAWSILFRFTMSFRHDLFEKHLVIVDGVFSAIFALIPLLIIYYLLKPKSRTAL